MSFLFRTRPVLGLLFVRLALGVVILPHGLQKTLGVFGGPGFQKTIEIFKTQYGFSTGAVLLLMATEVLGSLGLITGIFTRLCALAIATSLSICAYMNHIQNGFFMNWSGQKAGEGFEYHVLAVGMALALVLSGGGSFSIDRLISREK
ncbi:MAG: DoxX family protein [Nitrospirota bacterium]|jgi:putative oxidoreductase